MNVVEGGGRIAPGFRRRIFQNLRGSSRRKFRTLPGRRFAWQRVCCLRVARHTRSSRLRAVPVVPWHTRPRTVRFACRQTGSYQGLSGPGFFAVGACLIAVPHTFSTGRHSACQLAAASHVTSWLAVQEHMRHNAEDPLHGPPT